MARTSTFERLDYLSIFDPGHASVVWPYKDLLHTLAHRSEFDEQVRRILRFNLLWRPSILLRHIDLFNNISLMRFMKTDEAAILCDAGLLRVTVPRKDRFADLPKAPHLSDSAKSKGSVIDPEQRREPAFDDALMQAGEDWPGCNQWEVIGADYIDDDMLMQPQIYGSFASLNTQSAQGYYEVEDNEEAGGGPG